MGVAAADLGDALFRGTADGTILIIAVFGKLALERVISGRTCRASGIG